MYKEVVGLAFILSVMTATGIYTLSLGLGIQYAVLVIGMGWVTVLLLILGLVGRTGAHSKPPPHSSVRDDRRSERSAAR